jgi:threonine/homoserine/homoserine lactone efflux protein
MPGPLLAVTIRHTTRQGFVAAPLLVLGHAMLEAGLLCLLVFGLTDWLKGDLAVTAIALLGAAMLLRMSIGMAREVRTLRFGGAGSPAGRSGDEVPAGGGDGPLRPLLDGVVASASNPYWSLWWATIGLGYMVLSRGQGWIGLASFFAGHILADAAWYLFVGSAVAAGRGWFTDRVYRGVVGACAVFLAFFAVSFGYMGFSRLLRFL